MRSIDREWNPAWGTPVFTVAGKYATRGWTEWTQGFQFGSALLQFAATGDRWALAMGREGTRLHMAGHVSHLGVHDHGFNNVSTYGNLYQMAKAKKFTAGRNEILFWELALKISGAVQAGRWTDLPGGLGFIYSFNGPHSLFADTLRSLRALALSHRLGHALMGEGDRRLSLMHRLLQHAQTTARFNVYFGRGRDHYDIRGRVAHESIFNLNDGSYRCPSTQQGYSPFTTWTRGLAWILCGYAEQLEFLDTVEAGELRPHGGKAAVLAGFLEAARAAADFYIAQTPVDGVPYWDTGAPGLARLGDYLDRPADPFNDFEPVDSSAAAIAAQGPCDPPGALLAGAEASPRRHVPPSRRRPDCGADDLSRTLPERFTAAPGAPTAYDISPAQRMGSRAEGPKDPVRRVGNVGGGDYHGPRAGVADSSPRSGKLLHFLWFRLLGRLGDLWRPGRAGSWVAGRPPGGGISGVASRISAARRSAATFAGDQRSGLQFRA